MSKRSARQLAFATGAALSALALTGCGPSFTISGDSLSLLSPRHDSAIDLTIANPHFHALEVSRMQATIVQIDAPHSTVENPCSEADFAIALPDHVSFTVPARSSQSLSDLNVPSDLWPRISLTETGRNQDGCLDATLKLGYSADSWVVLG